MGRARACFVEMAMWCWLAGRRVARWMGVDAEEESGREGGQRPTEGGCSVVSGGWWMCVRGDACVCACARASTCRTVGRLLPALVRPQDGLGTDALRTQATSVHRRRRLDPLNASQALAGTLARVCSKGMGRDGVWMYEACMELSEREKKYLWCKLNTPVFGQHPL
ncbi:hypothetical protein DFH27DRAFT_64648 [Peziza echinospora]|nr:hypothetical protein DFH27DRAFT_64648 [Peziza echinospora]